MGADGIGRLILVGGFVLGAAMPPQAQNPQELNNLWMGGYDEEGNWPEPWGGVDLDFVTGVRAVSTVNREISFFRTNANITDSAGNLLFSTNGAYLANATGVQMQGGGG